MGFLEKWKVPLNFLLFQVGWFACVWGAGEGQSLLGPLTVLLLCVIHLLFFVPKGSDFIRSEIGYLVFVGLFGGFTEFVLRSNGAYEDKHEFVSLFHLAPLWFVALWVNFALSLKLSLSWLKDRYLLATLLGGIFGPLSYVAGEKFDAIEIGGSIGIIFIGVAWALSMPLLIWSAWRIKKWQVDAS